MNVRALVLAVLSAVSILVVAAPTSGAQPYAATFAFFSGIPNELTNPGGSLPGSNDPTCKPSAAHPNPVVLVHGTGGGQQTNWGGYVSLLSSRGYCVFAPTLGAVPGAPWPFTAVGGMGPIEQSAQQLATFIDGVLATTGAQKVDVVGHSQGTVVPSYYARFLGGATKIGSYVSIAPLWQGTDVAGLLASGPFTEGLGISRDFLPFCTACTQMLTGSPLMTALAEGGPYLPGIKYTNIATRYDEAVVPYTHGLVPANRPDVSVDNIVVQDGCEIDWSDHVSLAGERRAATLVLNALDPANPEPVPCDRVLPVIG